MKKLTLTLLLFLAACSSDNSVTPEPPVTRDKSLSPSGVKYAVFSDMRGDPDDIQSMIRLMHYPELTPSFIMIDNGHGGQDRAWS